MPEAAFIQYGSLGLVGLVVVFFVKIMTKLVDATVDNMQKLTTEHERSTKEIISEIRENSIALSQRLNDVQIGIVQSLSGGASRPPMGSRPR